jgi:hypothetical protein
MAITRIGNPAIADQRGVNFRNIIINGSMDIAQRGTSESGITAGGYKTIDRFRYSRNGTAPTLTMSQDTDVPTGQGFSKSLKLEVTTVNAIASDDRAYIEQRFEGQNLQYLKKGTSSAESLTASFWVKASVTGTYIAYLIDSDNTRQIAKSYTINSADTWEKKTITFDGDTSGTLDNDNAISLSLHFGLYAGTDYTSGTLATSWESTTNANTLVGQVDAFATVNNTWQITGVQLEAGQTASEFEFLPVDVNLGRCFRYYEVIAKGNAQDISFGATYATNTMAFIVTYSYKRTPPSADIVSGTNYYRFYTGANNYMNDVTAFQPSNTRVIFYNTATTLADNISGWIATFNASAYLAMDAEL